MKTFSHLWQYLAEVFLEWKMFQTKVVEKIKTHILCSVTFFWKSYRLWDNVEKYGVAEGSHYNMGHTHFMRYGRGLCTHARTHARTHWQIRNTSCFLFHERSTVLRGTLTEKEFACCLRCPSVGHPDINDVMLAPHGWEQHSVSQMRRVAGTVAGIRHSNASC